MLHSLSSSDEMLKCSPPPSKALSPHAPVIHVMKVGTLFVKHDDLLYFLAIIMFQTCLQLFFFNFKPNKVKLIIGSGVRTIKSIIEETGVYAIDARADGTVRRTW